MSDIHNSLAVFFNYQCLQSISSVSLLLLCTLQRSCVSASLFISNLMAGYCQELYHDIFGACYDCTKFLSEVSWVDLDLLKKRRRKGRSWCHSGPHYVFLQQCLLTYCCNYPSSTFVGSLCLSCHTTCYMPGMCAQEALGGLAGQGAAGHGRAGQHD